MSAASSLLDGSSTSSLLGHHIVTPSGLRLFLTASLGNGAHGSVYYAVSLPDHTPYAVKCIEYGHLVSPRQRRLQRAEATLHARCSDLPGVIGFHEAGDLPHLSTWYMVTEVGDRGDLFDALDTGSLYADCATLQAREERVRHLILGTIDTLMACHARGVYHRDLKPENFLIGPHNTLLLADFGLATDRRSSSEYGCGSAFYMAPEAQPNATTPYDPAQTDVWSLGILLINLVCQRNPWRRAHASDPSYTYHVAHHPHGIGHLLPFSPHFAAVISMALHPDPRKRASLGALRAALVGCAFPWFSPAEPPTPPVPDLLTPSPSAPGSPLTPSSSMGLSQILGEAPGGVMSAVVEVAAVPEDDEDERMVTPQKRNKTVRGFLSLLGLS